MEGREMAVTEVFYLGEDNAFKLTLKEDGSAKDLTSVTEVVLTFSDGTTISSDDYPLAFDFTTEAVDGKITVSLNEAAAAGLTRQTYVVEISVIDPTNTDRVDWGAFKLMVI